MKMLEKIIDKTKEVFNPKYRPSRRRFLIDTGRLAMAVAITNLIPDIAFSKNYDSLEFLKDLNNSKKYSEEDFLNEITKRINTEHISALIFGEEHGIKAQMQLAYETIKKVKTSKTIERFFDEGIGWVGQEGVFATNYGKEKNLLTKSGNRITHIMNIPYKAFNPIKLQEIKGAVKNLDKGKIIMIYTGNLHADSMYKNYVLSLEPQGERHGISIKQYPTVSEFVEKEGKRKISLVMYELNDLIDNSIDGFLRIALENKNKNFQEEKEGFIKEQRNLLTNLKTNKIYRIRDDVYVQVSNEYNLGYEMQLKVIDQYVKIFEDKKTGGILLNNNFYYTSGIYWEPGSEVGITIKSKILWVNGSMNFENRQQYCNIYFKDHKIIKVNFLKKSQESKK